MNRITALAFSTVLACFTSVFASTAIAQVQAPCADVEFRQMDFWLGEWDLTWAPTSDSDPGKGSNSITLILDDCVVQERFHGAGAIGHSVSLYHAPLGRWRQTWVDNAGGYFSLVGGEDEEGFRLDLTRVSDSTPYMRMIWRNIEANSMDWHWQISSDAGNSWTDQWVIHYTRRQ